MSRGIFSPRPLRKVPGPGRSNAEKRIAAYMKKIKAPKTKRPPSSSKGR